MKFIIHTINITIYTFLFNAGAFFESHLFIIIIKKLRMVEILKFKKLVL